MGVTSGYPVTCWNCLGEFDAIGAIWCSDDPKNPTKLCPFCLQCFCEASERYKQEFWRKAPPALHEELQTLARSKDRLGDVLIRLRKITTPELLEALVEQQASGRRLGEILVSRGLVRPEDIDAALKTQGVSPLTDTHGVAYAASPVWEKSEPEAIIDYLLRLAAKKGASTSTSSRKMRRSRCATGSTASRSGWTRSRSISREHSRRGCSRPSASTRVPRAGPSRPASSGSWARPSTTSWSRRCPRLRD